MQDDRVAYLVLAKTTKKKSRPPQKNIAGKSLFRELMELSHAIPSNEVPNISHRRGREAAAGMVDLEGNGRRKD